LFSAICLIASIASAIGTARSQHVSVAAYGLCIFVGVLLGAIAAVGNLSCASIVQKVIRNQRQAVKVAMLSLLLVASVGWIILADISGRWMSVAVYTRFFARER
jgi:hypothetical protein